MLKRKVIEIQAQTYMEEQFLLSRFPDAVWMTGVKSDFGTFYVPESKEKVVEKALLEWSEKTKNLA